MSPSGPPPDSSVATRLFNLSVGVCLLGGLLTSLVSLLVPRLKLLLGLSYAEALLVQFAFYSSYLLFAFPAARLVIRAGYMRAIATGLAAMTLGCIGLVIAQHALRLPWILAALLLLSAGITVLQIASNTVVALVGPPERAASRLTLLQGFNSLGTVLGPLIGAQTLLSDDTGAAGLPFACAALALAFLSWHFTHHRDMLPGTREPRRSSGRGLRALLFDARLRFGALAIFAYVGAEVTIGTLLPSYLMLPSVAGAAPADAGRLVGLYWGGAMLGRFVGAHLLRRGTPAHLLAVAALGATLLGLGATALPGPTGAVALLSVGLFNAIMYPTIYALALPEDEEEAPMGAMLLCMAVVGGAVVPVATGLAADAAGLAAALALPASCYLVVLGFALRCGRDAPTGRLQPR